MECLQARDNGFEDQIGQAQLPLSFELADVVQFVCGCNSNMEAMNLSTIMVLASKVYIFVHCDDMVATKIPTC